MHYQVLKGLLITSHLLFTTTAIGIDGKLDFGTSHSSTSSLRNGDKDRNTFTPFKYSKTIKSNDDFENIGVVCTSTGCNASESTSSTKNEDGIQTDVLVHIQTKVDFKQNKTESTDSIGETPDIPIVVGYGGSQLDSTVDDDNGRSVGPQSIFVPDTPGVPNYKSISNFDSKFKPPSSLTPTIVSQVGPVSTTFDGLDSSVGPGSFYGNNPPSVGSRIDGFGNSFDNLNPPDGFYVTKSSPGASRVDYISRSFDKLDPAAKAGFYPLTGNSEGFKPLSSVSGGSEGNKDIKYKENGIEIKIPYFDPSYHNHYYGENPPPQYVWYSKRPNGFNPVEFKTIKSTWTPSLWNRKVVPHRHGSTIGGEGVKCTCKEEHPEAGNGLRWYPDVERKVPSFNDPGSQINDKLAPLN
ncbi:uncharacterized protein LOC108916614 [Anoplophora glabripennis]|uniref:uncharacterized protein LOC108916614 n=1 Tax=Anoplophora glabripennis TaxID=217634 RepID=UPI0008753560|nr:uncharacterized protein LOC108916614 [Anoplophora glabripennis]